MSVFIKVIVTQDLNHLIISGAPSMEQMSESWEKVLEAYLDDTCTDDDRYLMDLVATSSLLEFQITKAELILKYLNFRHDPDMIAMLKKMGAATRGYPKAGSSNEKRVWRKSVIANVRRWKHNLIEAEQEIERLTPTTTGEAKPIMASYFDDIFAKLSQHYHFHIDEKITTVSRFLAYYRDYKNYLLTLKRQSKTP